jgi:CRP-like cAMP-binding protein
MENLIALFNSIAPLSPALEAYLRSIIKRRHIARKEILLREGDVARHIYFIEKGLFRSYYFIQDIEVSSWFMKENDIFVSVQSFFFQSASYETIEALEDSVVWCISYDQLQHAYAHFHEFHVHRGTILEKYYALSEQRHYMTRRQAAYDRYAALIEKEPELIYRVHAKHLASYLGLNTSTLSHIRAKYTAEQKKKRDGPAG